MAFLLRFDGVDDSVSLSSPISSSGDGVLAEIDFEYKGASNDVICGGTSFSDFWRINNDSSFRISIAGTAANVNTNTPLVSGDRYILRLVRTGSSVAIEDENGVTLTSPATFNTSPFVVGRIGSFHNGSSNLAMDLYGFAVNSGANNYDPSASNGTGSILDDTVGGNDGTLINFPTDDSQWVFFDDGGGALNISPVSIPSGELFGVASVQNTTTFLEPEAVASLESVGSPSISAGLAVISPDSVESEEFVPEPVLDLLLKEILVGSIPDTFDVGRPVVVGGDRIVIPVLARTNFTKIKEYLETLGFSGALEDTILAWLRSEGYEGQWNDAWYAYLEDLGHTGAFPERLYKWRKL